MSQSDTTTLQIIAPPPVLYISVFLTGIAVHFVSPVEIFSSYLTQVLASGSFFILSAAFARWAFVSMRKSGTTADPTKPSRALVTSGPFRLSRNPIYVAMTGLYLGICFMVNSAWPAVMLPLLLLLMDWGVIRREERYLSAVFGEAYATYKSQVRRWI